ncbi:hypothetical protein ACVU7I_10985 [Patulibacter sp. S7RM1-6]
MSRRLAVLPLVLTAALGLAACGGDSDEDRAQDLQEKSQRLQEDIRSGDLSADEIAERTKELANDPAVKEQLEKLGEEMKKVDPEELEQRTKDALKQADANSEQIEEKLRELREQTKDLTVPSN